MAFARAVSRGHAWVRALHARDVPQRRKAAAAGIDHTALAVRSLEASTAFYTRLGFKVGARALNHGPEQARLDGLADPVVDIVTLLTAEAGPHIELLHYRSPISATARDIASGDIAATETVLAVPGGTTHSDGPDRGIPEQWAPDRHRMRFTTS